MVVLNAPWWAFFEKAGGLIVLVGGIITAIAATFDPHDDGTAAGWLAVGIVAVIVGAVVALSGLIGQLFAAVRTRRGDAQPASVAQRISQDSFSSDGASSELSLIVEEEVWSNFEYRALFLEAKLRVTNHTDREIKLSGMATMMPGNLEYPSTGEEHAIDVMREEAARQFRRSGTHTAPIPGRIDPHDSVAFWIVRVFPHHPQGGTPGYSMHVEDEVRHEYGFRRPATPK